MRISLGPCNDVADNHKAEQWTKGGGEFQHLNTQRLVWHPLNQTNWVQTKIKTIHSIKHLLLYERMNSWVRAILDNCQISKGQQCQDEQQYVYVLIEKMYLTYISFQCQRQWYLCGNILPCRNISCAIFTTQSFDSLYPRMHSVIYFLWHTGRGRYFFQIKMNYKSYGIIKEDIPFNTTLINFTCFWLAENSGIKFKYILLGVLRQ